MDSSSSRVDSAMGQSSPAPRAIVIPKKILFDEVAAALQLTASDVVVSQMGPELFGAAITVTSATKVLPSSSENKATFPGDFTATREAAIDSAYANAVAALEKEWKLEIIDHHYSALLSEKTARERAVSSAESVQEACKSWMQDLAAMEASCRANAYKLKDIMFKYRTALPVHFRYCEEDPTDNDRITVSYAGTAPPSGIYDELSMDLIDLVKSMA